jgi:hypothetical protein
LSDIEVVSATNVKAPLDFFTTVDANCPTGKVAIGGGYEQTDFSEVHVIESKPKVDSGTGMPTGWRVHAVLHFPLPSAYGSWFATAYAICADAP